MNFIERNGRFFVNTTPHSATMADGEDVFDVPPSGVLINATPVETPAGAHASGAALVRIEFRANAEAEAALAEIESAHPGAIVIGSIVAAQAFPGRVLGMIPAPGFERVPPPMALPLAVRKALDEARGLLSNPEPAISRFDMHRLLTELVEGLDEAAKAKTKRMRVDKFTTF